MRKLSLRLFSKYPKLALLMSVPSFWDIVLMALLAIGIVVVW